MRPAGPLAVLALVLLAVACGPSWTPHPVDEVVGAPWGPAPGALLGTDSLGRDVFSRTLAGGTRLVWWSVPIGLATTAVGTVTGLLASRSRGLDRLLTATSSLVLAVPSLVVVLSCAVLLPSPVAVTVGMLLLGSPLSARIVRAAVVPLEDAEFLRVAERRGEPALRLVVFELLPALSGTVVADVAVRILAALQLTASLHVLGFGPQPPAADWALMLREDMPGIQLAPWSVLAPAAAMTVVAVVLTLCLDRVSAALAPTPTLSVGRRRWASRLAVTSTALDTGNPDAPGEGSPDADAADPRPGTVLSVTDLRLGAAEPLLVVDRFDLDDGRVVGIRGDSGAGKTTLLEALVGAGRADLDVDATRHLLFGRPLPCGRRARVGLRRRLVGWCEQDAPRTLDAAERVRDVITDARSHCRDVEHLAGRLGLPSEVLGLRADSLSGGQAARVALARALAGDPGLLLLDEPTAGLDPATVARVTGALQEYCSRDGAAVVVSHDHGWLDQVSNQVLEVRDGLLLPARRQVTERGEATGSTAADEKPLASWHGLQVLVGGRTSISHFDLDLPRGSVLALVAPSGAGKSTLLRALGGDVLPSGLEVRCPDVLAGDGRPATELMVQDSVAALNPGRSLLAQVARQARLAQHLDRRQAREVAAEQLAALGIDGTMARRRPGQCSGGERQRAALARALVSRAPVLLLDEPTSALDPSGRRRVMAALRHRAADGGAVVLATHDVDVAARADLVVHLPLAGVDGARDSDR